MWCNTCSLAQMYREKQNTVYQQFSTPSGNINGEQEPLQVEV